MELINEDILYFYNSLVSNYSLLLLKIFENLNLVTMNEYIEKTFTTQYVTVRGHFAVYKLTMDR